MTARRASRPEPAAGAKLPPYRLAPVAELVPYARNSQTHSPAQVSRLAEMITEFGWTNPVLVDGKRGIIAGHGRVMAAQQLGMAMVPTIELRHLTERQKRAYVIADNQSARLAGTDRDILASELLDLRLDGFDLALTGFDALELDNLLGPAAGNTDPDDAPPVQAEAVSRLGDTWHLGRHRLTCGDCTDAAVVAAAMAGAKPQLAICDPPYGVQRDKGFGGTRAFSGGAGKPIAARTYADDWDSERPPRECFDAIRAAARECIIFGGNFFADYLPVGNHWIVWDKLNTMPSFGDCELAWTNIQRNSVRKYTVEYNGLIGKETERFHPTQKPVKLFTELVSDYSEPSAAIYDPFLGSGTTIIAAEQTGRAAIGIEISPNYCDVAIRRWEAFAGATALHTDGRPFSAIAAERTRRAA